MASLSTKIKLYIEDNSDTWDNTKVSIQNDGTGDFIKVWNYDFAKPTKTKLKSYETNANIIENNAEIDSNRKNEYPSIVDQLDDIYHNGIDGWKTTIKAVKDKYPKE